MHVIVLQNFSFRWLDQKMEENIEKGKKTGKSKMKKAISRGNEKR